MKPANDAERKRKRSSPESIEKDFHDALDRLISGQPRNTRLRKLSDEGRLSINPTTVALEAERSRTLIALENCRFPSVRARIHSATTQTEPVSPRNASEVIKRLRDQVVSLKKEIAASLEAQANHFLAREKAEREAERWRNALRRQIDHAREDEKIVPLRPPSPES